MVWMARYLRFFIFTLNKKLYLLYVGLTPRLRVAEPAEQFLRPRPRISNYEKTNAVSVDVQVCVKACKGLQVRVGTYATTIYGSLSVSRTSQIVKLDSVCLLSCAEWNSWPLNGSLIISLLIL